MRSQRRLPFLIALTLLLTWALFGPEICRAQDLALVGAKIYPSPAGPATEGGTVLVRDGRIAAVGPSATIQIPKNATVLDCRDMVVKGPRILTVGEPFWTKGGTPVYAKDFLEANHISIPDVESNAQGVTRVRQQIHDGADGIKVLRDLSSAAAFCSCR